MNQEQASAGSQRAVRWIEQPSRFTAEQWLWLQTVANLLWHHRRHQGAKSDATRLYYQGGFEACSETLALLEQEFPAARLGALEGLNHYSQLVAGTHSEQRGRPQDTEIASEFLALWQVEALFEQIKDGKVPASALHQHAPPTGSTGDDVEDANGHGRSVSGAPL